jgi:hypothetical protein
MVGKQRFLVRDTERQGNPASSQHEKDWSVECAGVSEASYTLHTVFYHDKCLNNNDQDVELGTNTPQSYTTTK